MRTSNPFSILSESLQQRVTAELHHNEYINQPRDRIFEEDPVSLDVFLYGKEYMAVLPLSQKQFAFIEAGTQIYYPETLRQLGWGKMSPMLREEVVKVYGESGVPADGYTPYYHDLVAKWGKGSGKDTVSRLILARIAYLLLCLKDPQNYLEIMPGDSINMINVAYSAKQAQVIFFEPLKRLINKSIWFRGKVDKFLEDHIQFKKDINLYSGHSEQESMEGHNLIAAVLDEIAAFKTEAELAQRQRRSVRALEHSAEALAKMVTSSATSRFPELFKIIYISFTRFKGDFIEQKYDEGLQSPRTSFVSWGPTWEVNPTKRREHFAEEYRKDPENSAARYECKPPKATDAYFKHLTPALIEKVFDCTYDLKTDSYTCNNPVPISDNQITPVVMDWFRGITGVSYFAHIDLGLSKDRAGICVCHRAGFTVRDIDQVDENGREWLQHVTLPKVKVDFWFSMEALPSGEIDFSSIRDFINLLNERRNCHFGKVTFDGWQSIDSIQQLKKRGIDADTLSVDRDTKPYDTLKELIYDQRLVAYYRRIGIGELERLNIVTGNKVDHPLSGSKDEADALAGAVFNACEAEIMDINTDILEVAQPYNDTYADYGMTEQSGMWTRESFEGREPY